MASKAALTLASLVHILLRLSIFIEQPKNHCSTAPALASILYLVSTLMVVYDSNIYPRRYTNIPAGCQTFVEIIMILLLIEFSTVVIWCNLEKTFYRLLKCILFEKSSNMYYDMGGDFLAGGLMILFSGFIFMNAAIATDLYYSTRNKVSRTYDKLVEKIKGMWQDVTLRHEAQSVGPEFASNFVCDPGKVQSKRRSGRNC